MPASPIEEIKARLDIIDIIGGYLRLTKAGRNWKANCPFHAEKSPSFMVSQEKQLWRCFGCGKGGSIFDFVMEIEGMEFGDALKVLAQRAGVELKKVDPKLAAQWRTQRHALYEICELAAKFFEKQLAGSQAGKKMTDYLAGRGLTPQTIADWRLGYAPEHWQSLADFLTKRGYHSGEIVGAGLAIESEKKQSNRRYYDRFRDRIMFPLCDTNGQVIGFSGRENPDRPVEGMGKYINTPNTLIYDKSRVLYGLDRAKIALRQKDQCVLVEGQMDLIMSHQAGFTNTLAVSGTALTENHLKIIKRYTENLAMAFDVDSAGEIATGKAADLAMRLELSPRVILVPTGKDPADCLLKDAGLWQKALTDSKNFVEFFFEKSFAKGDLKTVEGKKSACRAVLPVIKKIGNKIEQAHWLQQISQRLKIDEHFVTEEMGKIKADPERNGYPNAPPVANSHRLDQEEYVLGLILAHGSLDRCRHEPCEIFSKDELKKIFDVLKKEEKLNLAEFKSKLPDELAPTIDDLVFRTEAYQELAGAGANFDPEKEIDTCFCRLKDRYLTNEIAAKSQEKKFQECNELIKQKAQIWPKK